MTTDGGQQPAVSRKECGGKTEGADAKTGVRDADGTVGQLVGEGAVVVAGVGSRERWEQWKHADGK